LGQLYEDLDAALPSVDVSFRDYSLSVAPSADDVARARAWWMARLPQLAPPQLPLRCDPSLVVQARFSRRELRIPAARWATIKARARQHDLTPSTVVATTLAEVLAAWSAHPALTLNLTLFDRAEVHPDINHVMGDFTSLLLVPYRPEPEDSWLACARRF